VEATARAEAAAAAESRTPGVCKGARRNDAMNTTPSIPAASSTGSDSPAVLDLLAANHRRFLAYVERRVESRETAEDILQDAFVRSLNAESLRNASSAIAWFTGALRNAIVDHYRRRGTEMRTLQELAAETSEWVDADDSLTRTVCDCVESLLPTLKPEYATALRRVELEETPVTRFAEEQGITANAAGVRLFRARQSLKKRVVQACGVCTDHGCAGCKCRG
jgi:RNA polymerase sigma factor (sigma-70 family)